jgi:hypothetical protein
MTVEPVDVTAAQIVEIAARVATGHRDRWGVARRVGA